MINVGDFVRSETQKDEAIFQVERIFKHVAWVRGLHDGVRRMGVPINWLVSAIPDVHVSGLIELQKCERRAYFGDKHWGLGFHYLFPSKYQIWGTWVHEALPWYYFKDMDLMTAFPMVYAEWMSHYLDLGMSISDIKEQCDIDNHYELVEAMLRGYQLHWENSNDYFGDHNLTFYAGEEDFVVPLKNGVNYSGRWDGYVQHDDGRIFVFETKTTSRDMTYFVDGLQYDLQPRLYAWALKQVLGLDVAGVLYNVIKSGNPFKVKILQNGKPSKAKNELDNTTESAYLNELRLSALALGIDFEDLKAEYQTQLDYLRYEAQPMYQRHLVELTDYQIDNAVNEARVKAERMVEIYTGQRDPGFNFNRSICPECPFKQACAAMDAGVDYKMILQAKMVTDEAPRLSNQPLNIDIDFSELM